MKDKLSDIHRSSFILLTFYLPFSFRVFRFEREQKLQMTKIRALLFFLLAAAACHAHAQAQDAPTVVRDEQAGTVRIPLARGGKVELDNRTTGRIVVNGWDRDYIEAVATTKRGTEYVSVKTSRDASGQRVSLTGDYLPRPRIAAPVEPPAQEPNIQPQQPNKVQPEQPPNQPPQTPAPTPTPSDKRPSPLVFDREAIKRGEFKFQFPYDLPSEVDLEVKLPRYAEIELISVNRSEVEINDVETPVTVNGNRSAIRLRRVGAVEVRTGRGPVEVEGAVGLVDVTTEHGEISVRDVRGDVRVLSLSGDVRISCVSGRVYVNNIEGSVHLAGVGGDADATTVSSDISFDGTLRTDGRYHLKSMAGAVEMRLGPNPPGFTALLSSYRGKIEDGFALKQLRGSAARAASEQDSAANRLLGRYGNGQAQVTLDSFEGNVKLGKAPAKQECKQ